MKQSVRLARTSLVVACVALMGLVGCASTSNEQEEPSAPVATSIDTAAGPLDLATVELPSRLARVREHLLAGDFERALGATPGRGWIYGKTTRDVAYLYTLEAIARQESGDGTEARCRWAQARYLFPALSGVRFGDLPPLWVGFPRDEDEETTPPAQGPPDEPREVSSEVRAPVKLTAPNPRYTSNMIQRRVQGRVILQSIINVEGVVTDINVLKSDDLEIGLQAIDSACRWTFEPATLDGEPVPVFYNLTVSFGIE